MRWIVVVLVVLLSLVVTAGPALAADPEEANVAITALPSYPTEIPIVTASNATEITISSALLHGNVTDVGGGSVTSRGFDWGLISGNYSYSWNGTGSFGLGEFEYQIGGLPLDTQVFWRAFAENGFGRGNSTELSFWTSSVLYAPTNFTVTQIGPSSVNVTWTKGLGAETTIVRDSSDRYPRVVTDGYLAYNGTGTWFVLEGLSLSLVTYYFRAWSGAGGEYSEDYAEASIGGDTLYMIAFIFIGLFFMWLAYKSRELLICLVAFLIWLALSLWVFFSNAAIFDLSEGYVQILAYVFFIVSFVPLMWSMNQEIKHEAQGQRWSTYGSPPKEKKISPAERHRKNLRGRLGK